MGVAAMKRRWGRLAASAALTLLLGGCGAAHVAQDATPAAALPAAATAAATEVQSNSERQLVVLFRALLQLDRQPGLAIGKEQAEALLPIIRQTEEAGSVGEADKQRVVALLSPQQLAYYDKLAQSMKARMSGDGARHAASLSPQERDKLIEEFKNRKETSGEAPADAARPPIGMGKSVEQQLIELLESKVKP